MALNIDTATRDLTRQGWEPVWSAALSKSRFYLSASAHYYLRHADQCLAAAARSKDENERAMLLQLVDLWRMQAVANARLECQECDD